MDDIPSENLAVKPIENNPEPDTLSEKPIENVPPSNNQRGLHGPSLGIGQV